MVNTGSILYLLTLLLFLVQSLSHIRLFLIPWTVAHQASLSFTISQSLLKLMSIKSVIPSNHLILCCSLLLLPSIFLTSGSFLMSQLFASWSFSFSNSLSNEYSGLISFRIDWFGLLARSLSPCRTIR